ncbi:MAG: 3-isopropylmalate dehydratase small subunit [Capsulimonadaceae bacterium]|nr:3-isopropylmalate dehydratase small subunit [Capsulimonadaceae bacterium]
MDKFTKLNAIAAPLDAVNADTDQIIPKQFLKRIERSGFGEFLFFDWRYKDDGVTPNPDFELNKPQWKGAKILITGKNFGCGSSREHAPWALLDYGFHALIGSSFADIFFNNCFKNGILPVKLSEETVEMLLARAKATPGYKMTVDLETQTVSDDQGFSTHFDVDPFRRHLLLNGLDDIALTLQNEADITAFEKTRSSWLRGTATA